jgi:hypothetical protein
MVASNVLSMPSYCVMATLQVPGAQSRCGVFVTEYDTHWSSRVPPIFSVLVSVLQPSIKTPNIWIQWSVPTNWRVSSAHLYPVMARLTVISGYTWLRKSPIRGSLDFLPNDWFLMRSWPQNCGTRVLMASSRSKPMGPCFAGRHTLLVPSADPEVSFGGGPSRE